MQDDNRHAVRNRVIEELNDAGVLDWEHLEHGGPEYQEHIFTATVELLRLVQTLGSEIDELHAETARLRRSVGGEKATTSS